MESEKSKKRLHTELVRQVLTLATAAFGLVAALAWNNVIQAFVKDYIQKWLPNGGLASLFIYAVIITIIAVVVTLQLSKVLDRLENK